MQKREYSASTKRMRKLVSLQMCSVKNVKKVLGKKMNEVRFEIQNM